MKNRMENNMEMILNSCNDTCHKYPMDKTIVELFEKQVKKTPEKIALVYKEDKLSYNDLNKRVNKLARLLQFKGVKGSDRVAILTDNNNMEMIIGIFAILKAGGAYVPISPEYPTDRILDILKDSGTNILLANSEYINDNIEKGFDGEIINLEDTPRYSHENLTFTRSKLTSLVYVIYTSGSTGKPKGVMISQAALLNFYFGFCNLCSISNNDKMLKCAGVAFDVSISEIYPMLLSGGELHLIDKSMKMDMIGLNKYINENHITLTYMPPALYEQFAKLDNKSLRLITVGGDKLKQFKKSNYQLINVYGPTEATVWATYFIVDKDYDNIPIGKPLDNYRIYVVNKEMGLCEVGESGELCLSGIGLADGYLNRPEQTAKNFIPNPFVTEDERSNDYGRLYKTGDLAQWMPDGNIEFLGRIDFQVKIRGFRIELGEIENRLLGISEVEDVLVMALDDENGNKYLCGYYLASHELDSKKMKRLLSKSLPDYMIPSFLCYMESFPLNSSGKVDRKALPVPDVGLLRGKYIAPSNEMEKEVARCFEEVLNIPEIGIMDDFFELGGNSLKAVVLASRLQILGLNVAIADIFYNPTVEKLVLLKNKKSSDQYYMPIKPVPTKKYYAATGSQRCMYLTDKMGGVGDAYNLPMMIEMNGVLNREQLGIAIDKLIERHDILRTCFENRDGKVVQVVHEKIDYKKEFIKLTQNEYETDIGKFIEPFDLNKAPLFRIKLIKISKQKHVLFFDIHHILFDGTSEISFINELFKLYHKEELPLLKIQYKDYAEWEQQYIESEEYTKKGNYWLSTLSDTLPLLEIPLDIQREKQWNYKGDTVKIEFNEKRTAKLREIAKHEGVTLYTLLLTIYNVLLSKYSRQEEIIVGAATSGRVRGEIQSMIGMFVNMLPVRTFPAGEKSFKSFLSEVKTSIAGLLANQDYSLQKIVESLNVKPEVGRNPIFDVGFNYLGTGKYKFNELDVSIKTPKLESTQFDMLLTVFDKEINLTLCLDFKTSLFYRNTMENFLLHYTFVLEQVIDNTSLILKDIDLTTEAEKNEIMNCFNNTSVAYPSKTIVQLFEIAVKNNPDNIAIVHMSRSVTYRELNSEVNKLASLLRKLGVKRESRIGIYLGRDIEVIVCMLAVLKAGGCYVPIDSKYPKDRIEFMIEDSNSIHLLSTKELIDNIGYEGPFIDINDRCLFADESTENPVQINDVSDLACLIYTSGSTGKPKGAMLEHKNLVNFSCWYKEKREIKAGENIAEHSSFSFDAAIMGTYPVLFAGATEHILPEEIRLSLRDIDNYFTENNIKGCFFTTQLGEQYNEEYDNSSLRFIEVGGEKLKKYKSRSYKFINGYGPTESTVYVTDFDVDRENINIPIGKPLSNVKIYIVNNGMKICPVGIAGELCISGHNLGRGYLHRPDLTAEKFLDNPFCSDEEKVNGYGKIYKTGDLAKWLPDGNIEVIGRIDFQVKIRGFRVELGEIEAKFIENILIEDAVVLAIEDSGGNKFLCGYYVSKDVLNKDDIRNDMLDRLPDYMVPRIFVHMDKFPITPNGKVDRKGMPKPDITKELTLKYVAPSTPVEKKIAEIWRLVLGLDKVGIKDNFFDLGGNSLKAVSLVSKLQNDGMNVTMPVVFANPCIEDLARVIGDAEYSFKTKLDNIYNRVQKTKKLFDSPEVAKELEIRREKYSKRNEKFTPEIVSIKKDIKTILLTGATGYLGSHILHHLITTTDKFVYCLVRGKNKKVAETRVNDILEYYFGENFIKLMKGRVTIFNGDISSEKMGLDDEIYCTLTENVKSIIHTAALVIHYGEYQVFYNANVLPVKYLTEFALEGIKKDIHYVSTRSVCEMIDLGEGEFKIIDEYDDFTNITIQDNVYVKTKLEGELAIVEARSKGINTTIYRVGNLVFNSQNGRHQKNIDDNAFYQTINSYLNIGYVSDTIDDAEMSFIDKTAEAICKIFDKEHLQNEAYHLYNPNHVNLSEFLTSDSLGLRIEKVSFKKFIDIIYNRYEKTIFDDYIEKLILHIGWQDEEEMNVIVLQDKTNLILDNLGFTWGEIKAKDFIKTIDIALQKRKAILYRQKILDGISEEHINTLAKKSKLSYVNKDDLLIAEGEVNDKIYLIINGMLTESKKSYGGWEGVLRFLGDDSVVAEECVVGNRAVSDTSFESILKETVYLELNQKDLREIIMKDEKLLCNLFELQRQEKDKLKRMIIALS